ncbi:hypothetical protein Q8F55_008928 [Vanrija albida]|uniref:Major facilitator superfamily (MFS) profile domain-containing protein n=1 Tax=Vanrija albida TaxID=181172 RepID=A0ABR3PSH9_9TREE
MADAHSDRTATMDPGSKTELKSGASRASSPASPAASVHTKSGSGTPLAPAPANNHLVTADLPPWRFWAIFSGILMSIFLFALDQLIVATAIPAITAEFNSLTQLSWLASGFFLPLLGFNLIYSQWLEIFPSKVVILFAVFIFEVGSLVCGVAPSMEVLILGRAIAGAGAAGIFSGGIIVISDISPLHKRPQHLALIGVSFAIASVLGPLVGGAFADHVSWRWCFYINLPLGGLALAQLAVFLPMKPPLGRRDSWKGFHRGMVLQVLKCDWVGAAISMGWAVSLILALQWGGVTKRWNDGSVIACLVLMGVLPVVFFLWEWWLGPERQMFKIHLIFRRTVFGASITLFMLFAVFMIVVYYLSINLQAVYRFSATDAGVRLLPLIMVQIFFLILSSRVIPKIRYFKYIVVAGPAFLAIGSGLLYMQRYGDPVSRLYGYQVLLGVGIGLALQNSMLGVQIELKTEPQYISAGMGMCTFIGFAGRIIGISLGGSVFENMIQRNLHAHVPQLPEGLLRAVVNDATAVWTQLPEPLRVPVLVEYQKTLAIVYIIGVPLAVLGIASALIMKNDKLPDAAETKAQDEAAKARAAEAKGDVEAAAGAGAEKEQESKATAKE